MKLFLLSNLLFLSIFSNAAEISVTTRDEINHLFSHLASSGCKFNRNGSWYSSAEASAHLKNKYEYLMGKNQITTTESYIEKAASESNKLGKPYKVKCGDEGAVVSSVWLTGELQEYRKNKGH
ncbi:MAG: DUF5329 domain-containing protein [Pseudomonadota bacterium]